MKLTRVFSSPNHPIHSQVKWKFVETNINGTKTLVEVPAHWSDTAINILVSKYFRKAGVPTRLRMVYDGSVPPWLLPNTSDSDSEFGSENSARSVFHRLAGCWTYWGWREGYFDCEEDAIIFYQEIYLMLARQIAAPNSPQWFNTGLHWAYGISGPDVGNWAIDLKTKEPFQTGNSYERPQVHACFLTPIHDDLVNPGGIMQTWVTEAKIFKQGAGSGTNMSCIRAKGERLSGGGIASGVMSWLRIGDSAAGAIQSGGTTRRAALMRILNIDHPEIEDFINWKTREESKAAAMYVGSIALRDRVCHDKNGVATAPQPAIDRLNAGFEQEIFGIGWEEEAIKTVDGQNSNNSVRITDNFMRAVECREMWPLVYRTTGKVAKEIQAGDLWERICRAAWASADPGIQFHDTINRWNTCKADGEITTTNPCAEYNFLTNTACNLASIRLTAFIKDDGSFDIKAFEHTIQLWTMVLDISVSMASFPTKEFAIGTRDYRTLGLGYSDLGGLLAKMNIRYDSLSGRHWAKELTALMTGVSYRTSAELAESLGAFPRFQHNRESFKEVIEEHKERLRIHNSELNIAASKVWNYLCNSHLTYRNAQTTLIAPTGTISFVMDCATTGIEPFYSRENVKKLAGGGQFSIVNDVEEEDCALPSRPGGPCLSPMAHVRMVAAVQPFLSGAVSKTINLPNSATLDDVDKVYKEAFALGLKAVAIYREGSKLTQPLNAKHKDEAEIIEFKEKDTMSKIQEGAILPRGQREELPSRRRGETYKLKVGTESLYLRTGLWPDNRLAEIFLDMSRGGSTLRSVMECMAKSISIGLQYGVPVEVFVKAFINTKFEPAGLVYGHDRIKLCSSITDLIARILGIDFLQWDELAHVPSGSALQTIEAIREEIKPELEKQKVSLVAELTGDLCPECGNRLEITGTCKSCRSCGFHTGCG